MSASSTYRPGDIAVVEDRPAVYMPTRWEWMDGTWTAIPLSVGPVLGNVFDIANASCRMTPDGWCSEHSTAAGPAYCKPRIRSGEGS
ncbi:hypothetical protein GCM10028801_31550 [Nocardioides maradonensis]